MTNTAAHIRLVRRDGLSITRVEDDIFVVVPGTEEIFHLNTLGRALWELLAEPMSVAELTGVIVEAFPDQPREKITADVAAFVEQLIRRKLVAPET